MKILKQKVIRKQISIMTGLMMFSFVVEFVDILFDILYFNEVTGLEFQSYFHSGQQLCNFMLAFLFMGIGKSIITLRAASMIYYRYNFENHLLFTRFSHIAFTFVLEE